MFVWMTGLAQRLHELSLWLQAFIVETPIYVAAPAMVIIGTLDSSLLSLPEINDYLVVARCVSDPKSVLYFLRINGLLVLSVATTLLIVGVAVYVLAKRVRAPRQSVLEQVEEEKQRERAGEEELKSSTTAQQ